MNALQITGFALGAISTVVAIAWPLALIKYRRVVPTNMVHIVQRGKSTTSYGRSSESGNIYYEWPASLPKIGVKVTEFPESIFEVTLASYEAYDCKNVPFQVDVSAFFRLKDSTTVAERVASFPELSQQLNRVVQGSVRRILAQHPVEDIMKMRGELGGAFTKEVTEQVEQWGVTPVKTLELMNLADGKGSTVITDIKSVETARINKDSRVAVATNDRTAQVSEIEARRNIDLAKEDAKQQVGSRQADVQRTVGLANEKTAQEVASARKSTAVAEMAIREVEEVRKAEIQRGVAVVDADAQAAVVIKAADAAKTAAERAAEGTLAEGRARAESERLMLQAPVTAQLDLAAGIGANPGYQTYLVSIEKVRVEERVGVEMAKAIGKANLHVIANGSGGEGGKGSVMKGVNGLVDMLSPETGTALAGMATAMAATPEGKVLLNNLAASKMTGIAAGTAAGGATGSPAVAAVAASLLGGDGE